MKANGKHEINIIKHIEETKSMLLREINKRDIRISKLENIILKGDQSKNDVHENISNDKTWIDSLVKKGSPCCVEQK